MNCWEVYLAAPKYDCLWLEIEIKIKIGLLEDASFYYYDQNPFVYLFIYKFGNPSKVPITKALIWNKAKPWWILIVPVKWRHRANGII